MSNKNYRSIYEHRPLSDGFPHLEEKGADSFMSIEGQADEVCWADRFLPMLSNLIDLRPLGNKVLLIGPGPKPFDVKGMLNAGFDAYGVEPVAAYVKSGGAYLGDPNRILLGSSESIPFPDMSQALVVLRSVLEHVDSPRKTLQEFYRVLKPGGVVYITTTNRFRVSVTGENGEYQTPFFNWLPGILRESLVFHHLHFDPSNARFSPRPAVHWFSYADLCRLGRDEGFGEFYSPLDVLPEDDARLNSSFLRRIAKRGIIAAKYNPWLRSLALTQIGGAIFMLKRRR